jgi:hypothetical protein
MDLSIYCVDVGSIARGNFGWFGDLFDGTPLKGARPDDLVMSISSQLKGQDHIALGFECPLFVPVPDEPERLTIARTGEGPRPWSAGAGAGSLATGLTEAVWILRKLRLSCKVHPAYLDWDDFQKGVPGLFLWEAFVTGENRGRSHEQDAEAAVNAFKAALPNPHSANAVSCPQAYSLIGAALLTTNWLTDLACLSQACLVIRA